MNSSSPLALPLLRDWLDRQRTDRVRQTQTLAGTVIGRCVRSSRHRLLSCLDHLSGEVSGRDRGGAIFDHSGTAQNTASVSELSNRQKCVEELL